MRNRLRLFALAAALCLGDFVIPLIAPAVAQTLRIGVQAEASAMDPHFSLIAPSLSVARNMFDTLSHPDTRQALRPGLALRWRAVSATEWEYELRPDVRFHDGSSFGAEDVAFSLRRAPDVPNAFGGFAPMLRQISAINVVGPLTIRIDTAKPFPLMAEFLSAVPIVSATAARDMTTADFNSGKATIGTGPFRFVSWTKGDAIRMARNDGYWGGAPPWAEVTIRPIPDDGARIAALLSGSVDMIDRVPTAAVASLRGRPDIGLAQTVSNRVIIIGINVAATANQAIQDTAGQPLATNPLADPRVRQAIALAINRDVLVNQVMEGMAVPAAQLLPDGYPGTSPALTPAPADPAAARALLAEAGYPNGFAIGLLAPRDNAINDVKLAEAVSQMLTRIGLRVSLETVPFSIFQPRYRRGEFALALRGWGTESGEGFMALRSLLATTDAARGWGAVNGGRYSNPALDALLEQAQVAMDPAQREPLLARAMEIGMRDVGLVPLHFQVAVWGLRNGLGYAARADGYTLAKDVRPAGK